MILKPELRVYHGSYMEVEKPELSKCRPKKDFGKGFYVTTNKEQALRFTKTSVRNALSSGIIAGKQITGVLNEYILRVDESLRVHEFGSPDCEWLHCVVAHRNGRYFATEKKKWTEYDLIAGKIANDNTNLVITAYIEGVYGAVGSERADETAISFLEPEKLKNQICLRTERCFAYLDFTGSEKVWL